MINYVFKKLKLTRQKHLKINKKYFRPEELKYLKGDCTKARKLLGWKPNYTFEMLMDEMIDFWLDFYKKNKNMKKY